MLTQMDSGFSFMVPFTMVFLVVWNERQKAICVGRLGYSKTFPNHLPGFRHFKKPCIIWHCKIEGIVSFERCIKFIEKMLPIYLCKVWEGRGFVFYLSRNLLLFCLVYFVGSCCVCRLQSLISVYWYTFWRAGILLQWKVVYQVPLICTQKIHICANL